MIDIWSHVHTGQWLQWCNLQATTPCTWQNRTWRRVDVMLRPIKSTWWWKKPTTGEPFYLNNNLHNWCMFVSLYIRLGCKNDFYHYGDIIPMTSKLIVVYMLYTSFSCSTAVTPPPPRSGQRKLLSAFTFLPQLTRSSSFVTANSEALLSLPPWLRGDVVFPRAASAVSSAGLTAVELCWVLECGGLRQEACSPPRTTDPDKTDKARGWLFNNWHSGNI